MALGTAIRERLATAAGPPERPQARRSWTTAVFAACAVAAAVLLLLRRPDTAVDAQVARLGGAFTPIPYGEGLERCAIPQEQDIIESVKSLLARRR